MSEILVPSTHGDGSIVDKYGNIMPRDQRLAIVEAYSSLPVNEFREQVLRTIAENPITIIQAPTGSGKTTQIPKWMAQESDFNKKIIVTQPRRPAAVSNATRVSQELLAEHGNPDYSLWARVGYRTGLGTSSAHTSPLSFHTDGLELMRQQFGEIFPDVLFMDEVHGFSVPTEFLGMMARERLRKSRNQMKLILMSATLDPEIFKQYYKAIDSDIPVIEIPGRTYPVKEIIEDGENIIGTILDTFAKGKNILVFASGKKEIDGIVMALKDELWVDAPVFPLHRDIPKWEQEYLLTNDTGKPRIIVATNIAEESITIPYISTVVDLGRHKILSYNYLGIPELWLRNISEANRKQRAGRVGRTHPGEAIWKNHTPPEELESATDSQITRDMLDRYILLWLADGQDLVTLHQNAKKHGESLFFHNVDERLLSISLRRLEQLGAIKVSKTANKEERKITLFWRDLLRFPVDVYSAAVLMESITTKCSEDMIIAVAIMEKKWFLSKEDAWKELKHVMSPHGDIFTYINIFKLVTKTKISKKERENLIELGVNPASLQAFEHEDNTYKLYEMIDLSMIGIKKSNIKEIEDLIERLQAVFDGMGIELTSSTDISAKKTALAAWSLHMVFRYDKEKRKFHHREHLWEDSIGFQAWDISTVHPDEHHLYLGTPFIIAGGKGENDLALLTFITAVDEGHIRSVVWRRARLTVRSHSSPQSTEKTSTPGEAKPREVKPGVSTQIIPEGNITEKLPSPKESLPEIILPTLSLDEAIRVYAAGLEIFEHSAETNVFQTSQDAQEYYLKNLLPDWMIGHNLAIRKYLREKTPEEIFIFRQLIGPILEQERSRIRVNSREATERSFRFDTVIMETFLESKNPYIVAFREGRPLPLPEKSVFIWLPVTSNESEKTHAPQETAETIELKKQYAKLIGKLKRKREKIDIEAVKTELVDAYLSSIDEHSFLFSTLRQDFEVLTRQEPTVLQDWGRRLKKFRELEKGLATLAEQKSINIHTVPQTPVLKRELAEIEAKIKSTLNRRNMENMSLVQGIHEAIARISVDFFSPEYFKQLLFPRILSVTRKLIQSYNTKGASLRGILSEFLLSQDLRQGRIVGRYFTEMDDYATETVRQGDRFEQDIYDAVRTSYDPSYIQKCVQELDTYITYSSSRRQRLSEERAQLKMSENVLDTLTGEWSRYEEREAKVWKKRKDKSVPEGKKKVSIYTKNEKRKIEEQIGKDIRSLQETLRTLERNWKPRGRFKDLSQKEAEELLKQKKAQL